MCRQSIQVLCPLLAYLELWCSDTYDNLQVSYNLSTFQFCPDWVTCPSNVSTNNALNTESTLTGQLQIRADCRGFCDNVTCATTKSYVVVNGWALGVN